MTRGQKSETRGQKLKNCATGMKDKIKERIIIDIAKHPQIYEHLKKSAETNFRTIEQQALYYIWTALNIEENGKK